MWIITPVLCTILSVILIQLIHVILLEGGVVIVVDYFTYLKGTGDYEGGAQALMMKGIAKRYNVIFLQCCLNLIVVAIHMKSLL